MVITLTIRKGPSARTLNPYKSLEAMAYKLNNIN